VQRGQREEIDCRLRDVPWPLERRVSEQQQQMTVIAQRLILGQAGCGKRKDGQRLGSGTGMDPCMACGAL
jgi:hypothetical protein